MDGFTYTELKVIQNALSYKMVWDENLTQTELKNLTSAHVRIASELIKQTDVVEIDGLVLENTSGL